jgi:hypothetical protein
MEVSGRFRPQGKSPLYHWIEGLVGTKTVLEAMVRRKIPSHRRKSNPITPIIQPVAQSIYLLSSYGLIERQMSLCLWSGYCHVVHSLVEKPSCHIRPISGYFRSLFNCYQVCLICCIIKYNTGIFVYKIFISFPLKTLVITKL